MYAHAPRAELNHSNNPTFLEAGQKMYTSSLELIPYNPGDTIFSNTMNFDPTFTMIDETYQVIDSERMDQELDAVDDQDYDPSLY